ncbi:MAG: hypothetical protein ACSLE1_16280, partial [Sphingobium sp.]
DDGEKYALYTLSGAERSQFEQFGMPRATQVFAPTFKGEGIIRSDDILADERYGNNAPHKGMPRPRCCRMRGSNMHAVTVSTTGSKTTGAVGRPLAFAMLRSSCRIHSIQ